MTSQSGGGGVPSGAAGGVLGGTYPSPTFATNGSTPILGVVQQQLSGNQAISVAGTFIDACTVTLTPGTWLLFGYVTVGGGSNGGGITAQLWDGTSVHYASTESFCAASWVVGLLLAGQVVVPTGTTVVHLSATSTGSTATILAAALNSGVGNNATSLIAVRIL